MKNIKSLILPLAFAGLVGCASNTPTSLPSEDTDYINHLQKRPDRAQFLGGGYITGDGEAMKLKVISRLNSGTMPKNAYPDSGKVLISEYNGDVYLTLKNTDGKTITRGPYGTPNIESNDYVKLYAYIDTNKNKFLEPAEVRTALKEAMGLK